jgi:phage terminase Nu1 subunit (DNA packaging protein)
MLERNTPQKTLDSWKQIAAYLDRSERTVRRWEAREGLPIHRLGHQKHDTVFAYKHEIESYHCRYRRFLPQGSGVEHWVRNTVLSNLPPIIA